MYKAGLIHIRFAHASGAYFLSEWISATGKERFHERRDMQCLFLAISSGAINGDVGAVA